MRAWIYIGVLFAVLYAWFRLTDWIVSVGTSEAPASPAAEDAGLPLEFDGVFVPPVTGREIHR